MTRLVFAPPLPLNAFPYNNFTISIRRIGVDELKQLVDRCRQQGAEVRCYIRHPSTVRLLNQLLGLNLEPSAELYQYQHGDIIVVIGLKKPVRGHEVEVTVNDLDIALIEIVR